MASTRAELPGHVPGLTISAGRIVVAMRLHPASAGKGLHAARKRYQGFLTTSRPNVMADLYPDHGESRVEEPEITGPEPGAAGPSRNRGPFVCRAERFTWELQGSCCTGRLGGNPEDLDSLLRTLYAHLAPRSGGVLLHAASLAFGGRAHLFAGVSGAGKTTLSRRLGGRLAGGLGIATLSDELSLLTDTGTPGLPEFQAHSTPFWGEFRMPVNNGSAPLGRIFLLAKGPARVVPLSTARAQARLLRCLVCFERSGPILARSWDLLLSALARHPAAELFWDGERTDHIVDILKRERTAP